MIKNQNAIGINKNSKFYQSVLTNKIKYKKIFTINLIYFL